MKTERLRSKSDWEPPKKTTEDVEKVSGDAQMDLKLSQ